MKRRTRGETRMTLFFLLQQKIWAEQEAQKKKREEERKMEIEKARGAFLDHAKEVALTAVEVRSCSEINLFFYVLLFLERKSGACRKRWRQKNSFFGGCHFFFFFFR